MSAKRWGVGLGLIGLLGGASAFAQRVEPVEPRTQPGDIPSFVVQLNGGLNTFTGRLGDFSKVGASFGVSASTQAATVTGGPSGRIDVEAGYEGSENAIADDFGSGRIWRHNVSALVKGGVPFRVVKPYVGVGIGETYANVTDAAEASGFRNDWFTEFPLAAGVDFNIGRGIVAGVRGTYRLLLFDEFAEPSPELNNPNGNLMGATATVGGRF
ncbi:MAG: hypothetical protein IRZ16_13095 [Myxococcaceae bacterium]|nr:hypothetical protein [Myxococcaceae bacterium]